MYNGEAYVICRKHIDLVFIARQHARHAERDIVVILSVCQSVHNADKLNEWTYHHNFLTVW